MFFFLIIIISLLFLLVHWLSVKCIVKTDIWFKPTPPATAAAAESAEEDQDNADQQLYTQDQVEGQTQGHVFWP